MKIVVPDLISPSYFPAAAAVTLGFFAEHGVEAELQLISPIENAYAALRDGAVDIVAGSAHSTLSAFPRWKGAKLLCAQSQGMYWFLVMRSDLGAKRGDLSVVKGRRIGAAPWVGMGLRRLLVEAGIDLERDEVTIAPTPGSLAPLQAQSIIRAIGPACCRARRQSRNAEASNPARWGLRWLWSWSDRQSSNASTCTRRPSMNASATRRNGV